MEANLAETNPEKKGRGINFMNMKFMRFSVIALILCIVFFLPEFLISFDRDHANTIPLPIYFKIAIFASVFLLEYYVIIPWSIKPTSNWRRFALSHLLLWTVAMGLLHLSWRFGEQYIKHNYREPQRIETVTPGRPATESMQLPPAEMHPARGLHEPLRPQDIGMIVRDGVMLLLTIALALAMRLTSNMISMRDNMRELESVKRQLELRQLKAQLNPHFLFNTLNTIYALVAIDQTKAQDAIHRLSSMLRYSLYETAENVKLSQELKFLSDYVTMMQLRLPRDLNLKVRFDAGEMASTEVSPLLFINIVENAFKYGLTAEENRLIEISVTAWQGKIVCRASNSYSPTAVAEKSREGIGLRNLRQRLSLRYPDCSDLTIEDKDNIYTITLTIQIPETKT